jgi:hypothetical protein
MNTNQIPNGSQATEATVTTTTAVATTATP